MPFILNFTLAMLKKCLDNFKLDSNLLLNSTAYHLQLQLQISWHDRQNCPIRPVAFVWWFRHVMRSFWTCSHSNDFARLFAGDFTEERNCLNKPYKDGVISDQEEIMGKCYSPHSGNEGNSLFYSIYVELFASVVFI